MNKPSVDGWLIEFRTADSVFSSGNNVRISHLVGLCSGGSLFTCYHDKPEFKKSPPLNSAFLVDQDCAIIPTDADMKKCAAIHQHPLSRRLFNGNQSAIFLAGIAMSRNYGVISDERETSFVTVNDLCKAHGVVVLTADEFFAAI